MCGRGESDACVRGRADGRASANGLLRVDKKTTAPTANKRTSARADTAGRTQFQWQAAQFRGIGGENYGNFARSQNKPNEVHDKEFHKTFELLKELGAAPAAPSPKEAARLASLKQALVQHLRHGRESKSEGAEARVWENYAHWYASQPALVGQLDVDALRRSLHDSSSE